MVIDGQLLAYLEELSYLMLGDHEKRRLVKDLKDILDGMKRLSELDTRNITESSHSSDNANAFREDVVLPPFDRELILKNAPERDEEFFIAPKTV